MAKGLQAWKCKRCIRNSTTSAAGTPALEESVVPQDRAQNQSISRSSSAQGASTPANHGSAPPPERTVPLPRKIAPEKAAPISRHQDGDVIVIDDSDSDSSPQLASKSTKLARFRSNRNPTATASTQRPVITKATKTTARPSAAVHLLAQEEEESSSDASSQPPVHHRSESAAYQRPTSPSTSSSQQFPHPTVTTGDDDNIASLHPPPPQEGQASNIPATTGRNRTNIPGVLLSQQDRENKRDQFRRNAADNEKRKRMEHRQRQRQLLQAKIEEKEAVEAVALDVVDVDPNSNQQVQEQPRELRGQSEHQIPEVSNQRTRLSVNTPAVFAGVSTMGVPECASQQEMNLAPQWFHARTDNDGNDMWARALRTKTSIDPPSTIRRKTKAQRLGEAQPQIYNFDIIQWEARLKRGRR